MKIKVKGTEKVLKVNPNEWATIEQQGSANEYEIVERKTVWGVPLNEKGEVIGEKQEFEKEHWEKIMLMGSKSRWKRTENDTSTIEQDINNSTEQKSNDKIIESVKIADLQVELTQAQINETNAKTELTKEQIKDLKRKFIYFILGIIVGNIGTILKLFKIIK